MALSKVAAKRSHISASPRPSPGELRAPPNSPTLSPSQQIVTIELLQNVLIEINRAAQKLPESAEGPLIKAAQERQPRVRASRLEVKTVNEVYMYPLQS
jgi:hypothetical protein